MTGTSTRRVRAIAVGGAVLATGLVRLAAYVLDIDLRVDQRNGQPHLRTDRPLARRRTHRHRTPPVTFRPHDLRHTFAFNLAQQTGADAYELQRRLGHASQRYIDRYTNPPEHIAAGYVEEL